MENDSAVTATCKVIATFLPAKGDAKDRPDKGGISNGLTQPDPNTTTALLAVLTLALCI